MTSTPKPAPKHRGAPAEPAVARKLRRGVVLSGFAVASTGVAVSGGVAVAGEKTVPSADVLVTAAEVTPAAVTDRVVEASRSDLRPTVDAAKAALLSQANGGQVTKTEQVDTADPREIARRLLPAYGFAPEEFTCLDKLFERESHWNVRAANGSTGAYGIPQAMPGDKMATIAPDWQYNPETQIKWGLQYIKGRYGTPCGAWKHSQDTGWY